MGAQIGNFFCDTQYVLIEFFFQIDYEKKCEASGYFYGFILIVKHLYPSSQGPETVTTLGK